MFSWLKSRKGKLTIAAVLGAVAAGLTGEMTWAQVVTAGIAAIAANVLGIAIEDAGQKAGAK